MPSNENTSTDELEDEEMEESLVKKQVTIAQIDEKQGAVEFKPVINDCQPESMILLTGLKNIFQKQLPKMPKEYIGRLVYDRNHRAMAVVRQPLKVVGGISFRLFPHFGEIVFCAIDSTEQVKEGYGSRLMSHLKDYVMQKYNIYHFLTYADNYAIGYFKKQGFTTEITLDKSMWVGYIKDYEGGTIMQCSMIPKVQYLDSQKIIIAQRKAVYDKILSQVNSSHVYPALNFGTQTKLDPSQVPGLVEAGWTREMAQVALQNQAQKRGPLYTLMKKLVSELQDHSQSWPFALPVAGVPDYYDVIKSPMGEFIIIILKDLKTLDEKVDSDSYESIESFCADVDLIFVNCKTYNEDGTTYVKCANKLEKFFKEKLESLKLEFSI